MCFCFLIYNYSFVIGDKLSGESELLSEKVKSLGLTIREEKIKTDERILKLENQSSQNGGNLSQPNDPLSIDIKSLQRIPVYHSI